MLDFMGKVNGVLFTGGPAMPMTSGEYFTTATNIYNNVVELNSGGDGKNSHFPLWGTCLGFETIGVNSV